MRNKVFSLDSTLFQGVFKDSGQRLQTLARRGTYKDSFGHLDANGGALDLVIDQINLVETRKQEAEKVSKILGIKSLSFWGETDRALVNNHIITKKACQAILETNPATVYFPGPLEVHPDHRTTALIVWEALQRVRQENIYPEPISYEISVQNPINMLINISDQIKTKQKAMDLYVSQNGQNNYSELVLALDKGRTFSLPNKVKFAEGFFRYQTKDLNLSFKEMTKLVIDLYL